MTVPLIILAIPSLVIGALVGLPPDSGAIHRFLGKAIRSDLFERNGPVSSSTTWTFAIISSLVAVGGIFLAFTMYMRRNPNPYALGDRLHWLWTFLWHKWYFDEIYDILFVKGTYYFAMACWAFDRRVVDGAVNGVATVVGRSSGRLRRVQTGFVANYALAIALGAVLIVGVYLIARGDIFTQLFG